MKPSIKKLRFLVLALATVFAMGALASPANAAINFDTKTWTVGGVTYHFGIGATNITTPTQPNGSFEYEYTAWSGGGLAAYNGYGLCDGASASQSTQPNGDVIINCAPLRFAPTDVWFTQSFRFYNDQKLSRRLITLDNRGSSPVSLVTLDNRPNMLVYGLKLHSKTASSKDPASCDNLTAQDNWLMAAGNSDSTITGIAWQAKGGSALDPSVRSCGPGAVYTVPTKSSVAAGQKLNYMNFIVTSQPSLSTTASMNSEFALQLEKMKRFDSLGDPSLCRGIESLIVEGWGRCGDLGSSHVDMSFDNVMKGAAFAADDSSLYFAENGGTGMHQILSAALMNSGSPAPAEEDGMATFRAGMSGWQNRDVYGGQKPGKDGHHWIYSASGNCSVTGNQCAGSLSSGLWAVDTTNHNAVTRISLVRANGEGQDGQLFGVTGTPDGKYIYASAWKGGGNTGPDERQLFKIDALTNEQIGRGVPVGFGWNPLFADNNYVYGLGDAYLRVKIDGDSNSSTGDSVDEALPVANGFNPDYANAYAFGFQDHYLISEAASDSSCTTAPGKIAIVDVLTGVERTLTLPTGVLPLNPQFGADGKLYAFDLCSSTVMRVDSSSGSVLSMTAAYPEVGGVNATWPFGVMSHDRSKYVVGGGRTGGLIAVDSNPPRKPIRTVSPVISGSGLLNTNLTATVGTWNAFPAVTTSIQWYRCDKSVPAGRSALTSSMACAKVSGATRARFKITATDENKYLTVVVKAKNNLGTVYSTARSVRAPLLKSPTRSAAPQISGSASRNSYVTATSGRWSANPLATTSLQWYRCGLSVPAGRTSFTSAMNCNPIPGATKTRYKVVARDAGKYLTVRVTARNSEGETQSTARSTAKVR